MTASSPIEQCREYQYFSHSNGHQCKDLERQGNKHKCVTGQWKEKDWYVGGTVKKTSKLIWQAQHKAKFTFTFISNTWNKRNPLASDRKRKCRSRRNSTGTTEPNPSLSTRGVKVCDEQQEKEVTKMTEQTYRPIRVDFTCYLDFKKLKLFISQCNNVKLVPPSAWVLMWNISHYV